MIAQEVSVYSSKVRRKFRRNASEGVYDSGIAQKLSERLKITANKVNKSLERTDAIIK